MLTGWIVAGIALVVVVVVLAFLKKVLHLYFEMCSVFDELDFFKGDDKAIPQKEIQQKFENVLMIYSIEKGTTDYMTIVDTSRYLKNNVIGLTYVVPAQDYDKLRSDVAENVKSKMDSKLKEDDIEFEWLEDTIGDTMNGTIIPGCDVYQLKNGRWIWRSKFEHSGN